MKATGKEKKRGKVINAVILLLTVLLFTSYVNAQGLNGNDWNKMDKYQKALYLHGFNAGMEVGDIIRESDPRMTKMVLDYVGNMTGRQFVAIIEKYMRENPHEWGSSLTLIVSNSLADSFVKSLK